MLNKRRRLNKKGFDFVYSNGHNIPSDIGYFKVASWGGETQFSCVATKKNTQKSVDRTRIRRRGYAAIKEYLTDIPDGYGIIWFLPHQALDIDFPELTRSVEEMIDSLSDV